MKHIIKVAAAAAFLAVPMQTYAQQSGDVEFNGTVTHSCVINVSNTGGTLVANADFDSLSSTGVGGASGTAAVVATGNGFDLFIDAPSDFDSAPPEDTTDETFSASYSTTGASSISGSAPDGGSSTSEDLANGTTNVSVDLVASKVGTDDVFEAGAYTATVVLRCE